MKWKRRVREKKEMQRAMKSRAWVLERWGKSIFYFKLWRSRNLEGRPLRFALKEIP